MTAKEYLRQLKDLEEAIRDKREELIRLNARAESCSAPAMSGMPFGSGGKDKVSELVSRIVDTENLIRQQMSKLNDLTYEATKKIDSLADIRYRLILEKRYILLKDWYTIADELGYSVQRCYQLHGYALTAFSKILED